VCELTDAQRIACLRLIRSENVGPVTFRKLINEFGGAEAALEALPEIARQAGRKHPLRICPRSRAEDEIAAARRIGARIVFTIEPGYPHRLAYLETPPPMLYVKGRIDYLNAPSLAIVGARQGSAAGRSMARDLAARLGQAGLVIVSGLARGTDGAAHEAALSTGTIAVTAGGLDVIYPPEHEKLHAKIAERGCLVSEMPPGFRPRGRDFPRRNRLISGMSLGVLVIEAARRSGTLGTAAFAAEQGRVVFAIPGHPLDPRSEGTNMLLKQGATLVTSADDVLETLRPMTATQHGSFLEDSACFVRQPAVTEPRPHRGDDTASATACPGPASDPDAAQGARPPTVASKAQDMRSPAQSASEVVMAALTPAPVELDEIARATDLDVSAIRSALLELELAGRIVHHGANLVSAVAPPGGLGTRVR